MQSKKNLIILGVALVAVMLGIGLWLAFRPVPVVSESVEALDTQTQESPGVLASEDEFSPGKVEDDGAVEHSVEPDNGEIPEDWEQVEPSDAEKAMLNTDDADVSAEDESSPQVAQGGSQKSGARSTGSTKSGKAAAGSSKKGAGQSKKSSPGEERNNAKMKLEINYPLLVKNPDKLGFVPDDKLFREVYFEIRKSFVEQVSDEQLFRGVIQEVGNLLKAAHVSAAGLKNLDKRRNVLVQINDLFKGKVDGRLLNYAAIQGMLVGLDDPYSVLMSPEDYGSLQEQVQTKGFGGIGVYIESDKDAGNQITIFEPIEGTPAYKAGLEPGDQLLAIDGKSTKGMALDVATGLIRGSVGSKVVLKIRRPGRSGAFDVPVTRSSIHVVSATSKVLEGNVGYLRLRQFGSLSTEELGKELTRLQSHGVNGLILDLRNNGGGYIDAAVGIVGKFTPKNSLVVYTLDRNKSRRDYRSTTAGGVNMPVVVMVNRYSASASEITAGALRDHKVAKLVGEKSFGKGSVQQVFPFTDNSALKLTIARFYSPNGHVIDHKGLEPDYNVEMEPRFVGKGKKDVQLQKAISVVRGMAR